MAPASGVLSPSVLSWEQCYGFGLKTGLLGTLERKANPSYNRKLKPHPVKIRQRMI